MGARAAALGEGGGGKFNNIDGVILGYEFTTTHPFAKEGARRGSKSDFNPLYFVLKAQMDGAEAPDTDVMLVGSADDFEVSDEGQTLTPAKEGDKVWAKSQLGKFLASLEKLGVGTENDEYEVGIYNYEPIVNRRVRFGQEEQLDKNGKVKTRQGKGRDGKPREYKDTTTIVTADYGSVDVAADNKKGGKKKASPAAAATVKAAAGKKAAKEVDLTETADDALVGLLEKFGGTASKDKLVSAPAQLFLKKNYPDNSDDLRKTLYDDDYLNDAVTRGIIGSFEKQGKEWVITAAE